MKSVCYLLSSIYLLLIVQAIEVNVDSYDSIKTAARQVAKDLADGFWDPTSLYGVPRPTYFWWQHGAILGAFVDYWAMTGDTAYNENVTIGNDDQGFWSIMSMDAVERVFPETVTQKEKRAGFLEITQTVHNLQVERWDDVCGGGLRWQLINVKNGYEYKNTISNGLFFQQSARLARYTKNATYADWAEKTYKWLRATKIIRDDFYINDGASAPYCTTFSTERWTYNYGVVLAGCAAMYNFTDGSAYWKEQIDKILEATYATFFDQETGAIKEIQCQDTNTCDSDQRSFKAYLIRWMGYTAQVATYTYDDIMPRLRKNAQLAAATCTGQPGGTACGQKWNVGAGWDGQYGLGEQINALEAIQNIAPYVAPVGKVFDGQNGGQSVSNPGGMGSGNRGGIRNRGPQYVQYWLPNYSIRTGDRAGAAILTIGLVCILGFGVNLPLTVSVITASWPRLFPMNPEVTNTQRHNTKNPSISPYKCDVCGKSFRRREHVNRHALIHTGGKNFTCSTCNKRFARADILTRHQNSHKVKIPPEKAKAGNGFRACAQCATRRVRCSGGNPCSCCIERNESCFYQPSVEKNLKTGADNTISDSSNEGLEGIISASMSNAEPIVYDPGRIDALSTVPVPASPRQADTEPPNRPIDNPLVSIHEERGSEAWYTYQGPDVSMLDSFSSINWMSPSQEAYDEWNLQLAAFGGLVPLPISPEYSASFAASSTPWNPPISNEVVPERSMINQDGTVPVISSHGLVASPARSSNASNTSKTTGSTSSPYYVDHGNVRPSSQSLKRKRDGISNSIRYSSSSNGSGNPTEQPSFSLGSPPPGATNWVTTDVYSDLIQNLVSRDQLDDEVLNSNTFPSLPIINHLVYLFFTNFNALFPFIPRISFQQPQTDNWALLLAVASFGSKYSSSPELAQVKERLQNICQETFLDETQSSDRQYDITATPFDISTRSSSLPLIQARILNVLSLLQSGQSNNMRTAVFQKNALIAIFQKLNMLKPISMNFQDLNANRGQWEYQEASNRTGMMIWLLDFMFLHMYDVPSELDLADAKSPLPCGEATWDTDPTPTHQEYAGKPGISGSLQDLYIHKKLDSKLSEFGRVILIYAVCRQTCEIRRNSNNKFSAWIPSSSNDESRFADGGASISTNQISSAPSDTLFSKWRNAACDCFDILHWAANSKAAASGGFEHHTILHLHVSRLIILAPLKDIRSFVNDLSTRRHQDQSPRHSLEHAFKTTPAGQSILSWAVRDQYKARLSVIHAGAIYWYIRRYSCGDFVEPFAVFSATMIIWAYSVSVQLSRKSNLLSRPAAIPNTGPVAAEESDDCSDTDITFIQPDRPCDDESVQTYMRLGDKITATMARIGDILGRDAPRKLLAEGRRLLRDAGGNSAACAGGTVSENENGIMATWGISGSYNNILKMLEEGRWSHLS
ncbi:hypothetical protein H072_8252 [Dactylellina haptotyla CBS 200.50]|uniref:pH-response transcription factor pacC/RIM101 n=1 Tax=Dactylellina haptotyla (strain CBS 200.50) TaxID=1284197 RepID=S8BS29_DACHA|nr:hypothetical protein H072_8252 [Dactylellina haptotyla CBS 200.50]